MRKLSSLLLLLVAFFVTVPGFAQNPQNWGTHKHVVIIAEENNSYEQVVGNTTAGPYWNGTLIPNYGIASNWYATVHGSLSAYFQVLSGSVVCGLTSSTDTTPCTDGDPTTYSIKGENIMADVQAAGMTWKQYAECAPNNSVGTQANRGAIKEQGPVACTTYGHNYYPRHVPMIYYDVVRDGVAPSADVDCSGITSTAFVTTTGKHGCNVVRFEDPSIGFLADVNNHTLPNFSFITPTGAHDFHDASLATADPWLQTNIDPFLKSSYCTGAGADCAVYIWFDEGATAGAGYTGLCASNGADTRKGPNGNTACTGGGRVLVTVAGTNTKAGYSSSTNFHHEALTQNVLENLALPSSTYPSETTSAPSMDEFFTTQSTVPASHHVFLVMLGNRSFENTFPNGCCTTPPTSLTPTTAYPMPYLYQLANQYALAAGYYAESHYSLPNNFWLTAGTNLTFDDSIGSFASNLNAANTISTPNGNLASNLISAGLSWKDYAEGLPYAGYLGYDVDAGNICTSSTGCTVKNCVGTNCSVTYAKRHNPFAYFTDVANVPAQAAKVIPFSQFASDLASCTTNTCSSFGAFNLIVPDMANDGYSGTLGQADQWLQANIKPMIDTNPMFQAGGDGLLIIAFDQSNNVWGTTGTNGFDCRPLIVTATTTCPQPGGTAATNGVGGWNLPGGGYIPLVFVGPNVKQGYVSTNRYAHGHESVLRTIMESLAFAPASSFPMGAATADDMAEFFKPTAPTTGGGNTWTSSYKKETANNTAAADNWLGMKFNLGFGQMNDVPESANTSRVDCHTMFYSNNTIQCMVHDTPWWTSANDWSHVQSGDAFSTAGSSCTSNSTYPFAGTPANGYHACGSHMDIGVSSELQWQANRKVTDMMGRGVDGVITDWYGKGSREDNATLRLKAAAEAQGFKADGKTPKFMVGIQVDGGSFGSCTGTPNATNCKDANDYNGVTLTNSLGQSSSKSSCASLPNPGTSNTVTTDLKTCYVSKMTLAHLYYVNQTYMTSAMYHRINGRPVISFFSPPDPNIDWKFVQAFTQLGSPLYIFRETSGFHHDTAFGGRTDGAFSWIGHAAVQATDPTTSTDTAAGYLTSNVGKTINGWGYSQGFYYYATNNTTAAGKVVMGSMWSAFNNKAASWACGSSGGTYPNCTNFKQTNHLCGQTFLASAQAANQFFNATKQIPLIVNNTWTDYEEGSATEPGIDNCWSISTTVDQTNKKLNWTITGTDPDGTGPDSAALASQKTIDHFTVFYSDGVNAADGSLRLAVLQDNVAVTPTVTGGNSFSLDLSQYNLPSGTYQLFVKLQSKPFIHNSMTASPGPTYNATFTQVPAPTVTMSVSPLTGNVPITTTATLTANVTAPYNIVNSSVDWGDGTLDLLNATSGTFTDSHQFTTAGNYTVKFTATSGSTTDPRTAQSAVTASASYGTPTGVDAELSDSPTVGNAPMTVTADTSASTASTGATITSRIIDWGDGNAEALTGTNTTATHVYNVPNNTLVGNYTITAFITDSATQTDTATDTITVFAPAANTVVLFAPANNDYVYSPMRVLAKAEVVNAPITRATISADGILVYDSSESTNPLTIDKYVFLNSGASHTIVVTVYDAANAPFSHTVTVLAIGAH